MAASCSTWTGRGIRGCKFNYETFQTVDDVFEKRVGGVSLNQCSVVLTCSGAVPRSSAASAFRNFSCDHPHHTSAIAPDFIEVGRPEFEQSYFHSTRKCRKKTGPRMVECKPWVASDVYIHLGMQLTGITVRLVSFQKGALAHCFSALSESYQVI
jgi:hypothetical protein